MKNGDLTLSAMAKRVFFQTHEIEDVIEMLEQCVDKIFKQSDHYSTTNFSLSDISPNSANGVILLCKDSDIYGATGFTIKRESNLIFGQCFDNDLFKKHNLNSIDGLADFSAVVYEEAVKVIAKREAVKRFEARRKPS